MIELRPYQQDVEAQIVLAWASGYMNVLAVLPTGAGKTVLFSHIVRAHNGPAAVLAHRQELVCQISLALNRDGVRHQIIAPEKVVKLCVSVHMEECGRSYQDPNAQTAVVGVDTLISRSEELADWAKSVTLWVTDEAHHIIDGNKWGKACAMFPNAKGLGVTATPLRADGQGLGREADGVFDKMVVGPGMRDLIDEGYLTDYRIFCPEPKLIMEDSDISPRTGDYKPNMVAQRFQAQSGRIIGDIVDHYLKIAPGKLGITFVPDVQDAHETAAAYNARGVPAAVVSAKTPDAERVSLMRQFKNRQLHQLVNVDLFGEGVDVPAMECCSMARPTQSYGLYVQQFGRPLRLMEGKKRAIIIDHVGNFLLHGPPDKPRVWTLDRQERRAKGEPSKYKVCADCTAPYEKFLKECPHCGFAPEPVLRSSPEFVEGDLLELDEATLISMRREVETMDRSLEEVRAEAQAKYMPEIGVMAHVKRHAASQEMQGALRGSISLWSGMQSDPDPSGQYRKFYYDFGVDIMSAQALKRKEALVLANRINQSLGELWDESNSVGH